MDKEETYCDCIENNHFNGYHNGEKVNGYYYLKVDDIIKDGDEYFHSGRYWNAFNAVDHKSYIGQPFHNGLAYCRRKDKETTPEELQYLIDLLEL